MNKRFNKQQKSSLFKSESVKYFTPNSCNKYAKINFSSIDKHLNKIKNIKSYIIGVNESSNNNVNDYFQNYFRLKNLLINAKKNNLNESDFSNSEKEIEKSFQSEEIKQKKLNNLLDPHGYFPEDYSLNVYKQTNLYKNRYQIQTRNLKNVIKKIQTNEKSPYFINISNQMKKNNIENTIGIEEYRLLNSKKIDKFVNKTLNIKDSFTPKNYRNKNSKFRLSKNYSNYNIYNDNNNLRQLINYNNNNNYYYIANNETQTINKNKEVKKNFSVKEMKFQMINIPKKIDNNIFIKSYKKSTDKSFKNYYNNHSKCNKFNRLVFSAKNRSYKNNHINDIKNVKEKGLKFSFYNPADDKLQIFYKNNLL